MIRCVVFGSQWSISFKINIEYVDGRWRLSTTFFNAELSDPLYENIAGENVGTVVPYFKDALLLLLQDFTDLLADTLGLLNNDMPSATNNDFWNYTKSIYYESKHNKHIVDSMGYIKTA